MCVPIQRHFLHLAALLLGKSGIIASEKKIFLQWTMLRIKEKVILPVANSDEGCFWQKSSLIIIIKYHQQIYSFEEIYSHFYRLYISNFAIVRIQFVSRCLRNNYATNAYKMHDSAFPMQILNYVKHTIH